MRLSRFTDMEKPLSWLPNRAGFRFIALMKDGRRLLAVVDSVEQVHDETILVLRIQDAPGAPISDLKGWFDA